MKLQIMAIDDEPRALNRLKMLINLEEELELIGQFSDAEEGIESVLSQNPDAVCVDVEMPGTSGIQLAKEIISRGFGGGIIMISAHQQYAIDAFRAGAFDYLLKPIKQDELRQCFRRFHAQKCIDLNDNEKNIIRLLSIGANSEEIAEKLYIAKNTVDTYRRKIRQKTKTKNTVQLVRFAIEGGLI
jgi:DNA-binding NarL/FixJ family response regulator